MLFWACVYGDKQGLSRRHTVREDMVQSLTLRDPLMVMWASPSILNIQRGSWRDGQLECRLL